MTKPEPTAADLRGLARLVTEATAALADLVEAVHERTARLPGLEPPRAEGRTSGITGLVYQSVRGVTRLVGGSLEALLQLLTPALAGIKPPRQREAVLAALNGVMGDYLVASSNPLALSMQLRQSGRPFILSQEASSQLQASEGQLLLTLHGLCMNDEQWTREGHNHAKTLGKALGMTVLDLRYNTGLHISINGRALAHRLEELVQNSPAKLKRLVLLCHSMGGLVARSAFRYGEQAGHHWMGRVTDLVFLGSPHHGAPLEKAGNGIDTLLGATSYSAPFARLGQLRSAGITDLRHGHLVDEDWLGRDRFARGAAHRLHVPLPVNVRCYLVAGSLGSPDGQLKAQLKDRLLGDGLVPVRSALGQHRDKQRCLNVPADRQWVAYGINHMALLSDPAITAQLLNWLKPRTPS